jgi:hypothetical protein
MTTKPPKKPPRSTRTAKNAPSPQQLAQDKLTAAQKRAQAIQASKDRIGPRKKPLKQTSHSSLLLSNNNIREDFAKSIDDDKAGSEVENICSLESISTDDLVDDLQGLSDEELDDEPKPLSAREKAFLFHYFSNGKLTDAVKAAGYKSKHQQTRSFIGNRILRKYCESAGEHRKILRDLGASEAALLLLLWDKAQNARSENVQVAAAKVLAQVFAMLTDGIETPKGAQIRFFFDQGEGEEPESREKQKAIEVKPTSILR